MGEGYGRKKVYQLILAGASADDVFVIVLFAFTSLALGGDLIYQPYFKFLFLLDWALLSEPY